MNLEELKTKLKSYSAEKIIFRGHALERGLEREISREFVLENLLTPEKLIDFIEEPSKISGEKKFKLVFEISNKKCLIVVAAINGFINVITVCIRYRKWMRPIGV